MQRGPELCDDFDCENTRKLEKKAGQLPDDKIVGLLPIGRRERGENEKQQCRKRKIAGHEDAILKKLFRKAGVYYQKIKTKGQKGKLGIEKRTHPREPLRPRGEDGGRQREKYRVPQTHQPGEKVASRFFQWGGGGAAKAALSGPGAIESEP